MSYDNPEYDLLAAFEQRFGPSRAQAPTGDTRVLAGARHVYENAIDVSISMAGTRAAAASVWAAMKERKYSTAAWAAHELHPKTKDEAAAALIFTIDLLNFSFWSELDEERRFAIDYKGRTWTGYWSLVAALQRALDEGVEVTSPQFWVDAERCNLASLQHIFRSATDEEMPLLPERLACLQEAGRVLIDRYDGAFVACIEQASGSAAALVNLVAEHLPSFCDQVEHEGERVRFLKRAQILVADLWGCFDGQGLGRFDDIDTLTIFADYRVPQILHSLSAISYAPALDSCIRRKQTIPSGSRWEIQIRGCSIWAVELMRREIIKLDPEAKVNAVLIDFFLYDRMKELEKEGRETIPHHRTRSIYY